jgi:hypothetical protein
MSQQADVIGGEPTVAEAGLVDVRFNEHRACQAPARPSFIFSFFLEAFPFSMTMDRSVVSEGA